MPNIDPDQLKAIIGQDKTKRQLCSALRMDRHVLIIGPPGVGKTTLAKDVAKVMAKDNFIRVQGSPDLTVEDLIGDIDPTKALKYGPRSEKAFTPGKIFKANNGVLFFDEINRCPEKVQNSLVQALQERTATVGSYDMDMPADFIFIGTMNPEDSSTEKLSDVFLDRFDIVYMSYPEMLDQEIEIVNRFGKKLKVEFPKTLLTKSIEFVRFLRDDKDIEKKPSVRASLGLYERSQANAQLSARKAVTLEDVHEAIVSVLSHRIRLKPSMKYIVEPASYIAKKAGDFFNGYSPEKGDAL
ncbi:MAG: MoxR family ATPase [Nanoarchaeota archaeon]|nr:MoxR family ATPase [Nanoarchaeota archaeon]